MHVLGDRRDELTIFLANATRYSILLFVLSTLSCAIVTNSFGVAIVLVVRDLHDERDLLFLLALPFGTYRAPVAGDAVLVQLFKRLVEFFVLCAFASSVAVAGSRGGTTDTVLGLGVRL